MTEQELRDKIIGIVLDVPITGIKIRKILGGEATANAIADALISAGIGDVSEWKRRAKRVEKELADLKTEMLHKYNFGVKVPMESERPQLQQGWVCPKCGAVMSPNQPHCINCTKFNTTISD